MFRWENPSALKYLWLLPVFIIFVVVVWRGREKALTKALNSRLYPYLVASRSLTKRKIKILLEIAVIILSIVAWARPQYGQSQQKIQSQGIEMMVAIDVSNSMMAEDIRPSRLEHAKNEISRLLDRLSGDKVGLIAFAGSAVLLAPLTNDYSAIKLFLDSLTTNSVTTQGTNFEAALDQGIGAIKRGGFDSDEGARVTKVLLVVTDGETTTSDALKAAERAASQGLRVFTLGMGTKAGAPIPDRDEFGNLRGYKKDKKGQVVLTTTNEEELSKLARAGGGAYYHSDFSGQAIEAIKRDLDKMEKADFENDLLTNYDEKYQPILLAAFLLALIEFFMGERKRESQFWRGRFEVPR